MQHRIEFYDKDTGDRVKGANLIVYQSEVWQDTGESYESHAGTICFDDLIKPRPDLGFRVVRPQPPRTASQGGDEQ